MARQRPNARPARPARRTRSGAPPGDRPGRRTRPRDGAERSALTDEELRALVDGNVDPDDLLRAAGDAQDDEQEASDHDRDTTRDRIEGLLLEQDEQF